MPIRTIDFAMPNNNKNARLEIRLTNEDAKRWNEAAGDNSISQFVRDTINKYVGLLQTQKEEIQKAVNYVKNTAKRAYSGAREKARELYDRMPEYVPEDPAYAVAPVYR